MKTIMIIGAGFLQTPVIKKAKELGYRTISVDRDENAEGFIHSDFYKAIDIVDQEACLEYAKRMKIDGVLTAATDFGVMTASYIAKELNLPGLNYETAQHVKNKYEVRHILSENRIDDVSQYYEIDNIDQLDGIKDSIRFPVMVKPCDGSGSKGASRVDDIGDLKSASSKAIEASLIGKALIEDFIEGSEYGVESFFLNGEIYVLGIMKKIMTEPPIYAELGHAMPSGLTNELKKRITEITKLAIKALGINHG
ncbi:MAG: ATP-grasp domain-containing protein, partial [Clostridiales bacterium]|nr:ATP-grasp domain-containing protein [Clostridiales bacterium]